MKVAVSFLASDNYKKCIKDIENTIEEVLPQTLDADLESKKQNADYLKKVKDGMGLIEKKNVFDVLKERGYIAQTSNEEEIRNFLKDKLPETYIMEEYVDGNIVSFDGLCDSNSDCVLALSNHFDTNSSDMVEELSDDSYFIAPFELPMDDIDASSFLEAGKRLVKAFGIKKRFFHIEFFVLNKDKEGLGHKGEFVGLECNMRPCGGNTTDLYSIALNSSIYDVYADIIVDDINHQDMSKEKYYAIASSKRNSLSYSNDIEDLRKEYKDHIIYEGTYPQGYSDAMGDYYIYTKWNDLKEGLSFDKALRMKK